MKQIEKEGYELKLIKKKVKKSKCHIYKCGVIDDDTDI